MYNADEMHTGLMEAFTSRYPNFRAMRFVFSSPPGGGKSTVLSSVPVQEGKIRILMDMEDSCAYLDAGEDGADVYTPRRQQFRMKRKVFPDVGEFAALYQLIQKDPDKIGAVCIDNAAIWQDQIVAFLAANAKAPQVIKQMYSKFDATSILPVPGLMARWADNPSGNFWAVAKEPYKKLILACSKAGIHILFSTEESNVWVNYGKPNQKIIGQKAKIWDTVYRYTDAVISLQRDVNSTTPPMGQLYPNQPKMRLQGMNPKFRMDWQGFTDELNKAKERTEADIPKEAQVIVQETMEE